VERVSCLQAEVIANVQGCLILHRFLLMFYTRGMDHGLQVLELAGHELSPPLTLELHRIGGADAVDLIGEHHGVFESL